VFILLKRAVKMMQILVISGFLGAGKTTFIKKLVEMTRESFAILENEYGEVPVDGSFIRDSADKEVNIWELTEGCICCSVKSDFASSILTIANTLNPKYLIVEPTGVGMLSNIMRNIGQIQYSRIELLKPITVIDASCFASDMMEYKEIYCDQIASTSKIIFSKTEQLTQNEVQYLADAVRRLNKNATIEPEHYSKKSQDWWMHLLEDSSGYSVLLKTRKDVNPDLDNIGFENVRLQSVGDLVCLLEETIRGNYGMIRRAKGCVRIDDFQIRFDVVDGVYNITGISENTAVNAVFIGKALNRHLLQKRLGCI